MIDFSEKMLLDLSYDVVNEDFTVVDVDIVDELDNPLGLHDGLTSYLGRVSVLGPGVVARCSGLKLDDWVVPGTGPGVLVKTNCSIVVGL